MATYVAGNGSELMRTPPLDRIMQRVFKHPGGCWEWTGKGRTGTYGEYGGTRLYGKMMSTHRALWILLKGYVPRDLLHQCQMKLCCNPKHMREGTQAENLIEAVQARSGVHWRSEKNGVSGESHPRCKMPDKVIRQIMKDLKAGKSRSIVAAKYGTTTGYISMLVNGKTKRRLA